MNKFKSAEEEMKKATSAAKQRSNNQPLAWQVEEKVFLTKHVIEYLKRMRDRELRPDVEYEDLLDHLANVARSPVPLHW